MSDLPPGSSSLGTRHQRSLLRNIYFRTSYHYNRAAQSYNNYNNEDAITPCPPLVKPSPSPSPSPAPSTSHNDDEHELPPLSRSSSSSSLRSTSSTKSSLRSSIENMTRDYNDIDTQLLWRRMLAIQRTFGCYNSTRMNIAIEMGEQNASVPSRVCLDLLNDSIDKLPSEIKQRIEDFLACEDVSVSTVRGRRRTSSGTSCSRAGRKWSWRHLLHA